MYAQLQSQIKSMEKDMQDKEGTIETLERQLVQAGIKNKIMQGDVEVNKRTNDAKTNIAKQEFETTSAQKFLRKVMDNETKTARNNIQQRNKRLDEKSR
jgi:hypothetical protein